MKIIQAMKQLKDLAVKAEDLRKKIAQHSAALNYETPLYPDTKGTVDGWLQAHSDIAKEILRLRIAIQKTNLAVSVPIDFDGTVVTKTIAEWIHRRRDLAALEATAWRGLTDRGLKEGNAQQSTGNTVEVRIVRNFDPVVRDRKIVAYASEPNRIDSELEVVNATTDLIV